MRVIRDLLGRLADLVGRVDAPGAGVPGLLLCIRIVLRRRKGRLLLLRITSRLLGVLVLGPLGLQRHLAWVLRLSLRIQERLGLLRGRHVGCHLGAGVVVVLHGRRAVAVVGAAQLLRVRRAGAVGQAELVADVGEGGYEEEPVYHLCVSEPDAQIGMTVHFARSGLRYVTKLGDGGGLT